MTTDTQNTEVPKQASGRVAATRLMQLKKSLQAVLGLVLITILFSALAPTYRQRETFLNILQQSTELSILAAGATVVLISGGLDLSVGSIMALSTCVAGSLLAAKCAVPVAVGAAVGVGLLVGLVNGTVIVATGVPPFIVTLGMMLIARGLALMLGSGRSMTDFPESFKALGVGADGLVPIGIMAAVVAVTAFLLAKTRFGFNAYAIGGNAEVARLAGIPVKRYKVLYYGLGGMLAGLAGCVQTARFDIAAPSRGEGWELQAIAAVVIGGTSLFGGMGGVGRTIVGALIMGSLSTGLTHCHMKPYSQMVTIGAVIILAVWIDRLQRKQ
ncbi:MAG TPA: ABC transporter permease [Planctomycetota bacterium]|jgi:ribose/xylose/arabinose/galactoside ABC-type transport system permease subunit